MLGAYHRKDPQRGLFHTLTSADWARSFDAGCRLPNLARAQIRAKTGNPPHMTFFTSDTHFGHANIIKYTKRPFATAAEMDRELITRWNSVVQPRDTVYHLGDVACGIGTDDASRYVRRLHGQIHLVVGNHEKPALRCRELFASVNQLLELTIDKQDIVLCHYAMRVWNRSHKGAWHLYGHSHGTLPDDNTSLSLDIGVDCWNFYPVSVDQLRQRMRLKNYKSVDHHGSHTT